MLYHLKRHPFPVVARFEHCLVLTYAAQREALASLLPPGLELDVLKRRPDLGFLAIALVQTRELRPAGAPFWLGRDFFLSGYRVFARFRTPSGRVLRGLRILRSDTDSRLMAALGNRLTHYNYQEASVNLTHSDLRLAVKITTPHRAADLHAVAELDPAQAELPPNTCFVSEREARRFSGPLPYTFDYEDRTGSMIVIQATRQRWRPRLVNLRVLEKTFFERPPFTADPPVLVGAFYNTDVAYRWERGVPYSLARVVA